VISPFRKISSHNSEEDKAVFYASDDEDRNSFPDVEANQKSSSSSDLFNFKPESNQSREISRSLNFLNSEDADENSSDFKHNFEQRQAKTLPISSVSSPSPPSATATKFLRTMSIGAAFGSKGIGIGNKMGSEVPAQSERKASAKLKGKLTKMKSDMLGSGPLEGSPEPGEELGYDMSEVDESEDLLVSDSAVRDLSAWRVTIPGLEPRNDPLTGKAFFVYVIQVQRIDVTSTRDGEDLEWSVERQYQEFYSLQSALVQYHGIFEDVKLPPKSKLFGGKGLDVLQSKLEPFQVFIIKLLQKPNLKKSDLLFTFLTSKQEFNEASSFRMFKGVPIKLTKEKGQFLQNFIQTYNTSTQNPPPKPGKIDWDTNLGPLKQHPAYGDNFAGDLLFEDPLETEMLCRGEAAQFGVSGPHPAVQCIRPVRHPGLHRNAAVQALRAAPPPPGLSPLAGGGLLQPPNPLSAGHQAGHGVDQRQGLPSRLSPGGGGLLSSRPRVR